MSDVLSKNIPTTEELLMMFINVGYSQTGKVNKSTALAMMRYVNNDSDLQNKVNQGNNSEILKHKPKCNKSEIIAQQAEEIEKLRGQIADISPIAAQAKQWRNEHGTAMIKHKQQEERIKELEELLLLTYESVRKDYKSCTMDSDLNWSLYIREINMINTEN